MTRCLQILLVGAMISGCDRGVATAPNVAVRDSLGVRIVEHLGDPIVIGVVEVSAAPLFRHGVAPEHYAFQFISGGALLPDGGAVILDFGNQEAILLGRDGKSWSILAGKGEGPDEVKRVRTVHALGPDTIIVEDDGNAKFIIFVGGEFAESIGGRSSAALSSALMISGIANDGRFIMTTSSYNPRFEEPWFQGSVVNFDPTTFQTDTVARFDMAARRPRGGPENPFGAFGTAIATGGRVVLGRSDVPELRWLTSDGQLAQIVRWQPRRTYPTDDDWELFEAQLRTELPRINPGRTGAALNDLIERQLARYSVDPALPMPLFGLIHPDDVGRVWAEEYRARAFADGTPPLTVISEDGDWLGVVELPDGLRILDIRGGRILGVLRDELEVQSVAVFEVTFSDQPD